MNSVSVTLPCTFRAYKRSRISERQIGVEQRRHLVRRGRRRVECLRHVLRRIACRSRAQEQQERTAGEGERERCMRGM